MKPWKPNETPTMGVEQEFHLVDAETGDLTPVVDAVKADLPGPLAEAFCYELLLSVLEMRSSVHETVDGLVDSVTADRAGVAEVCAAHGAKLAAAGSHPFARWQDQPYVTSEHYQWVKQHHQYISDRLLAFGLHVHVGMPSAAAAIYAMNEMRRWTFPLLALSANSPYFEGRRTGMASTRVLLFGSMPRTGVAPQFESLDEIEAVYEKLRAAGDITCPGDLWWIVRPQPPLGTLEFRIFDMPTDVNRIGALAAICQAACVHYQRQFEAGAPITPVQTAWLDQNRWKAMRYDLDATIVDAATGELLIIREQLHRLLDLIAPAAADLGQGSWFDTAREMIDNETQSQWQVRTCEQSGGDLPTLALEIARQTLDFEG